MRLLESQDEQDRWLLENREGINTRSSMALTSLTAEREFLRTS